MDTPIIGMISSVDSIIENQIRSVLNKILVKSCTLSKKLNLESFLSSMEPIRMEPSKWFLKLEEAQKVLKRTKRFFTTLIELFLVRWRTIP